MGGKHLKKLRAEKSKVHLKKKKLPKGQNITDTTFKVKRILTIEQLKKIDKDEPVSNWNIPLKDLLIRLNHYNMTSRLNSLVGIKELLSNHAEILQRPSLKSLVSRLLDLLTDEEHKVRITAMDVLSYLFDLIPSTSLLPFYDVLNVHLGCAMTHRNASVQLDSLKFIEIVSKYSSEALKQNFWATAQSFLRILKKFVNESHELSPKLSRLDLVKFKEKMFHRFYLFMTTCFSDISISENSLCTNINISNADGEVISLRQSNNQYKQIADLSALFINSKNKSESLAENNQDEFLSLCSFLMPLMFETWIEFCPDQRFNGTESECVLTEGIATLLCVFLKTIMFLYEKSRALGGVELEHRFIGAHATMFKKCFTSKFPFSLLIHGKKQSSKKSESVNPCTDPCVLQNLIICYLSYSFKFVPENPDLATTMEKYVSCELFRTNSTEFEVLFKVVDAVINSSTRENIMRFSKKLVSAFDETYRPEIRRELSKALVKVILDGDNSLWREEQSILNWMRSLPELLCKEPFSKEVIQTVLRLVNRPAGAEVVKEVEFKAFDIVNNLKNFEAEGQKMMVDILYRCNCDVLLELLKPEVFRNSSYSQSLIDYTKNIFCYKLLAQSNFSVE